MPPSLNPILMLYKNKVPYSLKVSKPTSCVQNLTPQKYKQFSNQQTKIEKKFGNITILALTAAPHP